MTYRDILNSINVFGNGTNREGAKIMRDLYETSRTATYDLTTVTTANDVEARAAITGLVAQLNAKGITDITLT